MFSRHAGRPGGARLQRDFYVGIGGGAGAAVYQIEVPPLGSLDFNGIGAEGVFGELTIGYDYMLTQRMLVGVSADYRFGNIATTLDIGAPLGFDADVTLDHGYDILARLGYLVTPSTLAYVLGGYSHQHFDLSTNIGFGLDWDSDGYVVGAGLETVLSGNWTLKGEYRYTEYSGEDFGLTGLLDVSASTHTFHAALNYKLGGGSRAAATYTPVAYDYTGLKIGIAAGAGAVVREISIPPLAGAVFNGIGGEGLFTEFSVGYDWQLANNWVVGVGADYRMSGISTDLSVAGLSASINDDHGYDIIARLGYKTDDATLVYGLAGYAKQHFELETNAGFGLDWNLHGWIAGAGIETALNDRWTAKIEYRYTEFEDYDFNTGGILVAQPSTHTVRAGISYKLY
ncbi:MAG: outer membrane beta-barrel protein [Nitratireductor sp.]